MQIFRNPTVIDSNRQQARRRLESLKLAALFGASYDPDEYDAAILAYRRACAPPLLSRFRLGRRGGRAAATERSE